MAARKKKAKGTGIDMSDRDYKAIRVENKDGTIRHSRGNGDAVAKAMIAFVAGGGDLMKVVKDNKLTEKYGQKDFPNQGMFRMTLGNSLRALVRGGTPVKIGSIEIKSLDQRIADPALKESAPKTKKVKEAA